MNPIYWLFFDEVQFFTNIRNENPLWRPKCELSLKPKKLITRAWNTLLNKVQRVDINEM